MVKIETEIERQYLDDMLHQAVEYRDVNYIKHYDGMILKFFDDAMHPDWYITDHKQGGLKVNGNAVKFMTVTDEALAKAIAIVKEKYPNQFDNIIHQNDDAITHDCLAQALVYNDIIFD